MNHLLRPRIWPSFSPSCRLYEPEAGRPRVQHPAVALWHAHLHDLATAIHETSGLKRFFGPLFRIEGIITLVSKKEDQGWPDISGIAVAKPIHQTPGLDSGR